MARAQADPRFSTPPLPLERLKLRRRLLREKISGLITAIDALLQDPAPHVTDLTANIYHFHDTPSEIRALDAAIQGNLTGDKLKEDIAVSQHFDDKMRSCKTRVLLHPVGKAAVNSAAGGYVRTTWRSDNRERMGVPIVPQNTHFVSLPMVQPETRQQQLEPTIHDEHAANISSSIWMAPGDSAVNATHSESPVTKPCTLEAEDLTQRQMTVPICPQSTSLTVFPDSESTLLSSDWNEALGDDEADAFLPSPSKTDSHTLTPFREAYPRTHQIKELSDSGESKHRGIPFQPKISSPGDTTLIMHLDDAPKDRKTARLESRRKELNRCPPTRRKMSSHALGHVADNRERIPASHRIFQRVCTYLPRPASRFRIRRLPRWCRIRHSAKSPSVQLHSLRTGDGRQPDTKSYTRLLLFVTATVACPPTKQCTFWNGLVIKNHIKPPKLIGFPYDPGGYPKTYGAKCVILMHKEHHSNWRTQHQMRTIAQSAARANSPTSFIFA